LFINDLIICIKDVGKGVKMNNANISILCVDAVVLVAENENDWCGRNSVFINPTKSNISVSGRNP
jgi:hypothetical protein